MNSTLKVIEDQPQQGILLVNLGTPADPSPRAVREFLREFLSDRRVDNLPSWLWLPILYVLVLPRRPSVVAKKYASIWQGNASPLLFYTRRQCEALQACMAPARVAYAMRYGHPSIPEALDGLRSAGCTRFLVLPLYPQYSFSTTGAVLDEVGRWLRRNPSLASSLRVVNDYHRHSAYISALADSVRRHWQQHPAGERLILSFHGLPRASLEEGDPYYFQCQETARLLTQSLALPAERVLVTFQSRFGPSEWLKPYTLDTVLRLAREKVTRIDLLCPGFSADCLETLDEIAVELKHEFLGAGGRDWHYISCLNDNPEWITAMATMVQEQMDLSPVHDLVPPPSIPAPSHVQ